MVRYYVDAMLRCLKNERDIHRQAQNRAAVIIALLSFTFQPLEQNWKIYASDVQCMGFLATQESYSKILFG